MSYEPKLLARHVSMVFNDLAYVLGRKILFLCFNIPESSFVSVPASF